MSTPTSSESESTDSNSSIQAGSISKSTNLQLNSNSPRKDSDLVKITEYIYAYYPDLDIEDSKRDHDGLNDFMGGETDVSLAGTYNIELEPE